MDLTFRPETLKLAERVRRFVDEKVAPLEESTGEPADAELQSLREEAKRLGLWAPQAPREAGGQGIELPELCPVFEAAGRSLLGPLALGCAAPDEGNGHLLRLAGTPAQKEELLAPLQAGEIRSAFAMTEPAPGSGSDPAMMQTTARLDGDRWVIDGRKWFVSGAVGASFTIVAAVTGATMRGRKEITLFLVENGTPGFRIVRQVPVLGGATPGGHAEIELSGCGVFPNRVLGEVGKGYDLIQARLGPARLTHCMRWLGAATRALELAVRHARERRAFGKTLGEHEAVAWMLADSAVDIHASRLMVQEAAWRLSLGKRARVETSASKVFVAEAVHRVIDRAVQVCGALGISNDLPLFRLLAESRAFRIYDGPSEVHRMVIARSLLAGSPGILEGALADPS